MNRDPLPVVCGEILSDAFLRALRASAVASFERAMASAGFLTMSRCIIAVAIICRLSFAAEGICMATEPLPKFCVSRLGSTRWRAPGPVVCARFTVDGMAVAAAVDSESENGRYGVVLYDRVTGELTGTFGGHDEPIGHLDYSRDGKYLASCSNETVVDEVLSRRRTRLIGSENDLVDRAILSPDGTLLASAHHVPYVVCVWDWRARREVWRTPIYQHWAESLAFSPDGSLLVIEFDGGVTVWNARTGALVREWDREAVRAPFDSWKLVASVAFSADGRRVLVVGDQCITEYDVETGGVKRQVRLTPGRHVMSLFASTLGGELWAIGTSGKRVRAIEIWDAQKGERLRELTGHTDDVRSLHFSNDGKSLVSSSDDHTIRVWDVATGKSSFVELGHQHIVRDISFIDDDTLVSVGNDGKCRVWDARTARELHSSRQYLELQSLVLDRRKRLAFVGEFVGVGEPSVVRVIGVSSGEEVTSLARMRYTCDALALLQQSNRLLTTSHTGAVRIWDAASGTLLKTMGHFKSGVHRANSLALSPDEKTVAIGCGYGAVAVWSVDRCRSIHAPLPHGDDIEGAPQSVAYSSDGKLLAAAGDDGVIRIWSTSDYSVVHEFQVDVHENSIRAIAFSPDSKLLASADSDGAIRLWNVLNGALVRALIGHTGIATCVAFSPNGELLASGSYDTTILLWNIKAARRVEPGARRDDSR